MNKKLLGSCDELWVFEDGITEGMREEIEHFKRIKGESSLLGSAAKSKLPVAVTPEHDNICHFETWSTFWLSSEVPFIGLIDIIKHYACVFFDKAC